MSNYYIDTESVAELTRLLKQDELVTTAMGGVLPELSVVQRDGLEDVLDIACGPGGWALQLAQNDPTVHVTGVDISARMLEYARAVARSRDIENVTFQNMDILQPFDFPDASFDLVNGRFLGGVLSRATWSHCISECTRVLRPGGIIRIVDNDGSVSSDESSAKRYYLTVMELLYEKGKSFSPFELAIGPAVLRMLEQHGFIDRGVKPCYIDYSAGAPLHDMVVEDFLRSMILMKPFYLASGHIASAEFEAWIFQTQQMLNRKDFAGFWRLVSIWGAKS